MIYQWNKVVAPMMKVDAQVVGKRLESLRNKNGGELTKEVVLNDAKNPKSPIHDLFEWDNSVAAEKYRLHQAGQIIKNIEVHIEKPDGGDTITRAFVQIETESNPHRTFVSVQAAFSNPVLREQVVEKAKKELVSWKTRYEQYEELAVIFDAIDDLTLSTKA